MSAKLKSILIALNDIDVAAEKVLKKSLDIVNYIPTDYADEVLYRHKGMVRSAAINKLTEISTEWTEMAETVKKELPKLFEEDEGRIGINFDNSTFFSEIWSGDAYDKQEVEALRALEKDLLAILPNINRIYLMKKVAA